MQLRTMPISGGHVLIFDIVENCGNIGSLYPQSPFAAEMAIVNFILNPNITIEFVIYLCD